MKTLEDYKELIEKLQKDGEPYKAFKVIPGQGLCALAPFAFTVGLVLGLNETGYEARYCYPVKDATDALLDILRWDGEGHPEGNWIKLKGRSEISNPNYRP